MEGSQIFSETPPENSGCSENSGPHRENILCSIVKFSPRYSVWVAAFIFGASNSVQQFMAEREKIPPIMMVEMGRISTTMREGKGSFL